MNNKGSTKSDIEWGSFLEESQWNLDLDTSEQFSISNSERRKIVHDSARELLSAKRFPPISRLSVSLSKLLSATALWYLFDKRKGKEKSRRGISRRLRLRFVK